MKWGYTGIRHSNRGGYSGRAIHPASLPFFPGRHRWNSLIGWKGSWCYIPMHLPVWRNNLLAGLAAGSLLLADAGYRCLIHKEPGSFPNMYWKHCAWISSSCFVNRLEVCQAGKISDIPRHVPISKLADNAERNVVLSWNRVAFLRLGDPFHPDSRSQNHSGLMTWVKSDSILWYKIYFSWPANIQKLLKLS